MRNGRAFACRRFVVRLACVAALAVAAVGAVTPRGIDAAETLVVPPGVRVLVVAPHPDDESLAAGGLMQQVVAVGGRVDVLFLTDGDGYREAVEAATGHREPSADDYRAVGELRHAEALVALEHYRVLPPAATFLGFPDGGLDEIWRRGPGARPYASPYTRDDRPPYAHVFVAHARYVRGDLVAAIARAITRADPEWIVLPTPLDNHPDHCASFAFVLTALQSLAREPGRPVTMPDRLLTYLVHTYQGWPPPPSVPGPLPEPSKVLPSSRWVSLALTDAETQTKLAALRTHRTQAAVMDTLFRSFARPNELFAVLDRATYARMTPGALRCGPPLSGPSPVP